MLYWTQPQQHPELPTASAYEISKETYRRRQVTPDRKPMTHLFPLLSIILAVTAVFTPLLPAFFPSLGLVLLYLMRPIRAALMIMAWGLALGACLSKSPAYYALPLVILLTIPAILMEPQRIFVSLDNPKHVPASQAGLPQDALVLGFEEEAMAAAWPFATLRPRHLINDQIGNIPVLVAY